LDRADPSSVRKGRAAMSGILSNVERLKALYDPNYVRRVDALDGAPVQVCLESRMLNEAAGTGVETYARMLAACLPAAGASPLLLDDGPNGARSRARLGRWFSAARSNARVAAAGRSSVEEIPAQWVVRDVFREAQVFFNLHGRSLPVEIARPPQVMHWTYPLPLYVVGTKNLYTIHDLIPLTQPQLTTINATRHTNILNDIVSHAHGLVTVSETVRAEVIARFSLPASRVTNTFQSVDAPLQVDPSLPSGLRAGRYFFFCGRIEARKNLEQVARAHAESGASMPLVIVVPEVAGEERLEAFLRAQTGVVRLPWVPRPELLSMMRRARALLFLSLAEGFGLPVAEAMTLGCPVLCSNRGAVAEVAGEAAILVDPEQRHEIAAAIARLEKDDRLCGRLRAAGFARGRMFTQDVYARRLRALYANALVGESLTGERVYQ
jgi:glycosyltransferase involved in cell wall biosynthesis